MPGRWVGEGRLGFKDGKIEAVKCRATYFLADNADELKQNIRCATTAGKIEVYFDDMKTPVLKAEDKTFQKGFVGFGSFDDTGRFRRVTLRTKNLAIDNQADFFKPLGK